MKMYAIEVTEKELNKIIESVSLRSMSIHRSNYGYIKLARRLAAVVAEKGAN
jgi:hypothetical protein